MKQASAGSGKREEIRDDRFDDARRWADHRRRTRRRQWRRTADRHQRHRRSVRRSSCRRLRPRDSAHPGPGPRDRTQPRCVPGPIPHPAGRLGARARGNDARRSGRSFRLPSGGEGHQRSLRRTTRRSRLRDRPHHCDQPARRYSRRTRRRRPGPRGHEDPRRHRTRRCHHQTVRHRLGQDESESEGSADHVRVRTVRRHGSRHRARVAGYRRRVPGAAAVRPQLGRRPRVLAARLDVDDDLGPGRGEQVRTAAALRCRGVEGERADSAAQGAAA